MSNMTAVNPKMAVDRSGASSSHRSRRTSTEKTGIGVDNSTSNFVAGSSSKSQEIEAKYTKVFFIISHSIQNFAKLLDLIDFNFKCQLTNLFLLGR